MFWRVSLDFALHPLGQGPDYPYVGTLQTSGQQMAPFQHYHQKGVGAHCAIEACWRVLTLVVCYAARLHAVISTCEKGQLWLQALGVLAVMQLTAFLPDVISLASVIEFTS